MANRDMNIYVCVALFESALLIVSIHEALHRSVGS